MTCQPFRLSEAFVLVAVIVITIAIRPAQAAGDANHGEVLYHVCQNCHAIDKNGVGPMHKGVVGRTAGTAEGYSYSPALKNAKIVWTEDNLDKWLASPQGLVPGTKMFYKVANPSDRADLIAYLKERAQ
jgi:cytochrome c